MAYARSTCHPQIGSIDENKLVELYQELRRDSITAGGVPVAVRHIESIVRISEANAKMHLRDHVRNEDVDMAIRVMVESFIAAQKYSVQTTLRRKFRKYIVYKKHNNSLIMHILQQMVRDQMTFEQMRSGARGNIGNGGIDHDIERIEITKGSGSVIYGDSAMAGAIHFYTKKNLETKIATTMGNYGLAQTSASVGINGEKIDLNISIDNLKHDGYHKAATSGSTLLEAGVKDKGKLTKSTIGGIYTTDNGMEISLDISKNVSDTRYPNNFTDAQFDADPTGNASGNAYTFREAESNTTNFKVKRMLGENFELTTSRSNIDKETQFTQWYSSGTVDKNKYDYKWK